MTSGVRSATCGFGEWSLRYRLVLIMGASLSVASGAVAEEAAKPLRMTVNPSGYESPADRLQRMLDRRMRQSEFQFRHICRGCGPGGSAQPAGPFHPQATLNGAPPPSRTVETIVQVPAPEEPAPPATPEEPAGR